MWAYFSLLILMVIFLSIFTLPSPKLGWKTKSANSAVIGSYFAVNYILFLILHPTKPNYEWAMEMARTCGKMFVMFFPFKRPGLGCIQELSLAKLVMNSPEWYNRLWDNHYAFDCSFNKPHGLLFGSSEYWKEARKLTTKLLHQLDFFKPNSMEKFIYEEVQHLENNLNAKMREAGGELVLSTHRMFEKHTLNIVAQVMIGRRFENGEPIVGRILYTMNRANRKFDLGFSPLDIFPWLRRFPIFSDFFHLAFTAAYTITDYFSGELARRREAGTYKTNPIDFTDYFMLEIDRRVNDKPNYITDECFLTCVRDMIVAGTDTTSSTMEWALLQMSLNPHVQTKVQNEIDAIVGAEREPAYNDLSRMPYTQAVIHEILRMASPTPLTSRAALADSNVDGNDLPQGTMLGINIYAIHRSKDLWEDPEVFRPERFLTDGGGIANTEKIIPFGYGKRICIGEAVARTSVFLFFATLMKKFQVDLSDEHPPPSMANVRGLARCPVPYFVRIRPRLEGN